MSTQAQILANRRNAPKIELCSNLSLSKPLPCVAFCEAGSSTSVENPLQISSFMQNKANFRKARMNVTSFITKDYRKNDAFAVQKNKANTKPNKPNLPDDQMNVTIYITKEYENKSNWTLRENKANTKPNKPNPPAPKPRRFGWAEVN